MDLVSIDKSLRRLLDLYEVSVGGKTFPEDFSTEIERTNIVGGDSSDPHWHKVYLDKKGNGSTDSSGGHTHEVSSRKVAEVDGHSHELLAYSPRKTRGFSATRFKGGSDEKKAAKSKPAGIASVTPDVSPQPPADTGSDQEESFENFLPYNWLDEEYGFAGDTHERVGWLSQKMAFDKYAVLRGVLEDADHLLDVGCGTGLLYEWLTKEQSKNVSYYGIDRSSNFLEEFAARRPNIASRLRVADVSYISEESLPRKHFDVSVAFGVTADMGEGDAQYDKLRKMSEFMMSHSDVVLIEFWDKYKFKSPDAVSPAMEQPSTWTPRRVKSALNEEDFDVQIIRPLADLDFAVLAVRRELTGLR